MGQRLAGIVTLTVDTQVYMGQGDIEYNVSKINRTTLAGQTGVEGYSEMPVAGHISGNLRDFKGLKVADFNAMTNVTVTLELANGKVITGRNMWQVGEALAVNTQEGTVAVRWESNDVSEG